IASGYCFAGNAAILGCCDVVIATEDANIGMGGPAMIEGGGLGVYAPTDVGPLSVQRSNGVVDLVARDEAHATELAKQYLSYFQGTVDDWTCADQDALRDVVPVDRLRSYDVHDAIELLFDTGSVLELRREFGVGMITALARLEGRPVGVIANNPAHLAGAIDSDGADKAARFLQLCDAHGLPIVTLVDTPGMMVGPDVEQTALVRHCSRLFVTGANVSVPMVSVVLRKSYGLGAQAMMGGSTKAPLACISWPSGEFGGMGLEGAVRLGYRKELDACETDAERDALFRELVDRLYEIGKAVRFAEVFEIDDVIDPVDTRRWITTLFDAAPPRPEGTSARPHVDTW
ncbi:MAG: acyl-CoA carboxylase subunit beta, partial [Acidimicrobiia bacterium]